MSTTARESDGLELSFGPLTCAACGCVEGESCEQCRCHEPSTVSIRAVGVLFPNAHVTGGVMREGEFLEHELILPKYRHQNGE